MGFLWSLLQKGCPPSFALQIPFLTDTFHAETLFLLCATFMFIPPLPHVWMTPPCAPELISVPSTPLGSACPLYLIPAEDHPTPAHCSSIWLYAPRFHFWAPRKPFIQSLWAAGGFPLRMKGWWCIWFLPTARSHSQQQTIVAEEKYAGVLQPCCSLSIIV